MVDAPCSPKSRKNKRTLPLRLNGPTADAVWPVASGIPFPQGVLPCDYVVRLEDASGTIVPADMHASGEWPDGTVRWLSVRALLNPQVVGGTLSLRWGPGKELAPWQPASGVSVLRVRQEVGRVHVDTGVLSVEVPHGQPSALGIVKRDGCTTVRGALRAAIEEGEGPHFVQGPPDLVRVERAGVVYAQVLVEGNYLGNDRPASALGDHVYRYRYRLCFHAGLPVIRVEHTVVQQCGISADRRLRRSSIRVARLEGDPGFQIDHRRVTRLHQITSGVCEIEGEAHELRFTGVGAVSGALTAGVRDFWERYPKAIERRDRDLDIHLLDDSKSETVCAQGEAQTHELWLWFGHDAPSPPDFAELIRRPPLLHASAQWMCESGALGRLEPRNSDRGRSSQGRHRRYEQAVDAGLEVVRSVREARDEYGYRDYGDTRFEMLPDAWLNTEYDWGHAYLLQFARTADRRFFDLASACVRHMMDTDVIHYKVAPEDHLIGAAHQHSTTHTAGSVDIGHAWAEGMFEYAAFRDDSRAWEHARGMADFFARCVDRVQFPRYKDRPGARRPGWGLIALTAAFEYTNDRRYLEVCRRIAGICRREQSSETGTWVYPGGGLDDPRYPVGKTFMVALTLTGLMRYHRLTGDSSVRESFLIGVDWAIDAMWDEEIGGFRYIDVPFDTFERKPGSYASHMMEPLAYAFELTGNPRYRYVASRTWTAWLDSVGATGLLPKDIRDVAHYLPHHVESAGYAGVFPLASIRPAEAKHLRGFCIHPDGRLFAVGLFGLLWVSRDRGKSWRRVDVGRHSHIYAMAFATDRVAIAVGEGEEVLRSEDGGLSWSASPGLEIPVRGASKRYFYDIIMVSDTVGYTGGFAVAAKTEDGGKSWCRMWDAVSDGRWDKIPQWRSLCLQADDKVWAVGNYRLAVTVEDCGSRFDAHPELPDGGLCVRFVDGATGFVSGLDGTIWRTLNGGVTWTPTPGIANDAVWQLAFPNAQRGFGATEEGTVIVTSDGGETWHPSSLRAQVPLRAIAALDETTVVVGGDEGALYRSDDRGKSWQRLSTPP